MVHLNISLREYGTVSEVEFFILTIKLRPGMVKFLINQIKIVKLTSNGIKEALILLVLKVQLLITKDNSIDIVNSDILQDNSIVMLVLVSIFEVFYYLDFSFVDIRYLLLF